MFDIFVTAMEGGVGYWCAAKTYHWRGKTGAFKDEDHENFHAVVIDEDTEKEYRVDRGTIMVGLHNIKAGKTHLEKGSLGLILAADRENDASDIDAGLADTVVQAGLFGEVVYG